MCARKACLFFKPCSGEKNITAKFCVRKSRCPLEADGSIESRVEISQTCYLSTRENCVRPKFNIGKICFSTDHGAHEDSVTCETNRTPKTSGAEICVFANENI